MPVTAEDEHRKLGTAVLADAEPQLGKSGPACKPAGLRSPTVTGLQVAGWLLLACLFLPVCRSCNGVSKRPADGLDWPGGVPIDAGDVIEALVLLCVYGNGVLVALLVTVSAWLCSPTFWWRSFVAQFSFALVLGTTLFCFALQDPAAANRFGVVLAYLPPLLAVGLWVGLAMRRAARETAWARLQHAWSIAALVYMHLLCIFSQRLLIGYWLTLVALAGMVVAVELARHRMRHDLWDAAHPTVRPQFTLRTIFTWLTIVPLIFGYYQSIPTLVHWLSPKP